MSSGKERFEANLELIKEITASLCRRKRLNATEGEDFQSQVFVKLIEDDYRVLRDFQGRAQLKTFLTVVIGNLLRDYRDGILGKWRPSAEGRRLGPIALVFEQLTIRDGYTFDEAFELLRTNYQFEVSRAEVETIAARLPARTRRRFVSDEALTGVASDAPTAADTFTGGRHEDEATRLVNVLDGAMGTFESQDQLILAMLYHDGLSIAHIARTLDLPQKKLYVRLVALRARLRKMLEEQGFDHGAVKEILTGDRQY